MHRVESLHPSRPHQGSAISDLHALHWSGAGNWRIRGFLMMLCIGPLGQLIIYNDVQRRLALNGMYSLLSYSMLWYLEHNRILQITRGILVDGLAAVFYLDVVMVCFWCFCNAMVEKKGQHHWEGCNKSKKMRLFFQKSRFLSNNSFIHLHSRRKLTTHPVKKIMVGTRSSPFLLKWSCLGGKMLIFWGVFNGANPIAFQAGKGKAFTNGSTEESNVDIPQKNI